MTSIRKLLAVAAIAAVALGPLSGTAFAKGRKARCDDPTDCPKTTCVTTACGTCAVPCP